VRWPLSNCGAQMDLEKLIRDRYNRDARLKPVLLIGVPAVLAVFAWFPALRGVGSALMTLLGLCGTTLWLSQLARDRGSRLQPSLFAEWGGMPSVLALRFRDEILPHEQKARQVGFQAVWRGDRQLPRHEAIGFSHPRVNLRGDPVALSQRTQFLRS
jgi:hypothetical protein